MARPISIGLDQAERIIHELALGDHLTADTLLSTVLQVEKYVPPILDGSTGPTYFKKEGTGRSFVVVPTDAEGKKRTHTMMKGGDDQYALYVFLMSKRTSGVNKALGKGSVKKVTLVLQLKFKGNAYEEGSARRMVRLTGKGIQEIIERENRIAKDLGLDQLYQQISVTRNRSPSFFMLAPERNMLLDFLRASTQKPLDERIKKLRELMKSLLVECDFFWSKGRVHGDISRGNTTVNDNGCVKLIDLECVQSQASRGMIQSPKYAAFTSLINYRNRESFQESFLDQLGWVEKTDALIEAWRLFYPDGRTFISENILLKINRDEDDQIGTELDVVIIGCLSAELIAELKSFAQRVYSRFGHIDLLTERVILLVVCAYADKHQEDTCRFITNVRKWLRDQGVFCESPALSEEYWSVGVLLEEVIKSLLSKEEVQEEIKQGGGVVGSAIRLRNALLTFSSQDRVRLAEEEIARIVAPSAHQVISPS